MENPTVRIDDRGSRKESRQRKVRSRRDPRSSIRRFYRVWPSILRTKLARLARRMDPVAIPGPCEEVGDGAGWRILSWDHVIGWPTPRLKALSSCPERPPTP